MKKDMTLNRRERKQFSKQIAAKLKSMGLSNQSQMHPSGKRVRFYSLEAGGYAQMTAESANKLFANQPSLFKKDDSGQPQFQEVDVLQLRNVFKNMIRRLRKQPKSAIEAFLNMQVPNQPAPKVDNA